MKGKYLININKNKGATDKIKHETVKINKRKHDIIDVEYSFL